MGHAILGNMFLDARSPAWHKLGTVHTTPVSAAEAFGIVGEYVVDRVQLQTVEGLIVPQWALIRRPCAADANEVVLGFVTDAYELITPATFARLFDGAIGQPVETLGVLHNGAQMFITTKLPTIDVRGDEVEMYLIARNGMDGRRDAGCDISPVRVVCANTLSMSERVASQTYRVVHTSDAAKRLGSWMHDAYQTAISQVAAIKESFEVLSAHRVAEAERDQIIERVYPIKPEPVKNVPADEYQKRVLMWEKERESMSQRRAAAADLFAGAGTGMSVPAAAGTAWGLYNAVVEVEDYRRGQGEAASAADALFGGRAATKARAFDDCVVIASGGTLRRRKSEARELITV